MPVYGLGHYDNGRPFYAMRLVKGDSLRTAIKQFHDADQDPNRDPGERSVSLRRLLGRFLDVCNAVAYAHSRGVLHRDLKPGNILLGKYGETLIIDWGLAKVVGRADPKSDDAEPTLRPLSGSTFESTRAGSAIGTPGYMSPEQARGDIDKLGPASDVFSLGATLYHLLTGRPAFEGRGLRGAPPEERSDVSSPRRASSSRAFRGLWRRSVSRRWRRSRRTAIPRPAPSPRTSSTGWPMSRSRYLSESLVAASRPLDASPPCRHAGRGRSIGRHFGRLDRLRTPGQSGAT